MKLIFKFTFILFLFLFSNISAVDDKHIEASDTFVNIFYVDDQYFVVKGYYYYFDEEQIPFSINKEDTYVLSNERFHTIGNSTYVTMRLTADNGKSYDFESLGIPKENKLKIIKANEINRTIVPGTETEHYSCYFDSQCTRDFPIWDVRIDYEVKLDDGTTNKLNICRRERSKDAADQSFEDIHLMVGDEIELGKEVAHAIDNTTYGKENYWWYSWHTSKVYRAKEPLLLTQVILIGDKKTHLLSYAEPITSTLIAFKGYYFRFDTAQVDFKIGEYGSYFALVSEEREELLFGNYRIRIGIVSPESGKVYYFTTDVSNDEPSSLIDHFVERQRSVVHYDYDNFPDNLNPWCVKYELEIFLEDGGSYIVNVFEKKKNKRQAHNAMKNEACSIQKGDRINWNFYKFYPFYWVLHHRVDNHVKDLSNVFYPHASIQRHGKEIPQTEIYDVEARGPLRSMKYIY